MVAGAAESRIGARLPSRAGIVGVKAPNAEPPGDPVNLVVDDGAPEVCVGVTGGGQFLWLNRFTPVGFPVGLTQIQVFWSNNTPPGCNRITVGDLYDLFMYSDTDGNPANGAVIRSSHTGRTVATLGVFNSTSFSQVHFLGPGDILVAVVNRAGMDGADFPASLNMTASQVRSWLGIYAGNPPVLPPIPAPKFGTIPGNWLIRASGTVTPVELQRFNVE